MIANIQVLRFLAAAAVVYYHTGYGIFGVETEFGAVPVFFCVSGFIMTMISRKTADAFLWRRIIRIVPLYWVLTFAYWAMITLPGGMGRILSTSAESVLKSLFFVPYENSAGHMQPILNVGWTLNYEMYFYALFGLALLFSRKWAPLLCAVAIVGIALMLQNVPSDWARFYAGLHVFYFVGGIGLYYLNERAPRAALLTLVAALTVVAYPLQGFLLPHASWSPVALVLAVLVLERSGYAVKCPTIMMLGAASYAIYLGHFLVLHAYRVASMKLGAPPFETNILVAVGVTLASIAFGVLLHLYVELPLTRALRQKRRGVATA